MICSSLGAHLGEKLLYLSSGDIADVGITMSEMIEVVEAAFREKGEGSVKMPPKIGVHPMRRFRLSMPWE